VAVDPAGIRPDLEAAARGNARPRYDSANPAALLKAMETAGVTGDVHLVGGPRTMQAFRDIGALAEVGLLVIPRIQGGGVPLAPPGTEPLSLTLRSTRTFPDGVIEARYTP